MIKASELRPFNLVYRDGKVYEFNPADYCAIDEGGKVVFFNKIEFEPIPLTEEWLRMFGFNEAYVIIEGDRLWQCGNTTFLKTKSGIYASEGTEYIYGKPLQYVHQIQNLYFALTGEELQIKQV